MRERQDQRWWIVGGVALVLILGYALPKYIANPATTVPAAGATVPPQLFGTDSNSSGSIQSPGPTATQIAVYVCGSVRRPGVYRLGSGMRVADGIARAGGALQEADLEQINLAEPLIDAMKIDVPKKGQVLSAVYGGRAVSGDRSSTRRPRSNFRSGRSSHKLQPGQTLNINSASESELTALPGVGPGLARRIIEYRAANGPFQTVDDLQNVSGIGASKFDRMAPYIRL